MLLLYFIFKEQEQENLESGSVTVCSHQFSVDSLHRRGLTVHSIDILTQDPSAYRMQIYMKNRDCYSYTKIRVSIQMVQKVTVQNKNILMQYFNRF